MNYCKRMLAIIVALGLFTTQTAHASKGFVAAAAVLTLTTAGGIALVATGFTVDGIKAERGLCKGSKQQYCCPFTCSKMPPNTTTCDDDTWGQDSLYCTNATGFFPNKSDLVSDFDPKNEGVFLFAGTALGLVSIIAIGAMLVGYCCDKHSRSRRVYTDL